MMPEQKRTALWIVLFSIMVSSSALPFLLVKEPPLMDYPNHLARVFILNHLHDPAFTFSNFYRADWKPYPYILWDALMVALQQMLPVEVAGKLLLMLTTMLLPVAVAWFLWQANRTEIKLAFLACALSYYALFLWGFVAYHLSVGLCFLMVGTWLWYRREPSAMRAVLFAVLCFLTYFAHVMGFASAAFILVLYELTRFNWRECFRLACFLVPPSALFLWARPGLSQQSTMEWQPIFKSLHMLRGLLVHGYNKKLDAVFLCGLILCLFIAVAGNRELRINWRWLTVALGLFVVFLLLPYRWGINYDVDSRLAPPLYFVTLAVLRVGRRINWIVPLAVALTAVRVFNISTGFQRETLRNVAMNHAIEHIARNARVFSRVEGLEDKDALDGYYGFFYTYSVIRRGATAGGLYDIPGQTPMRVTFEPYTYDFEDRKIDWKIVSRDYDYIWSYDDKGTQPNGVADKVFEEGPLILYRVRRP
jgi:hypothetical protein